MNLCSGGHTYIKLISIWFPCSKRPCINSDHCKQGVIKPATDRVTSQTGDPDQTWMESTFSHPPTEGPLRKKRIDTIESKTKTVINNNKLNTVINNNGVLSKSSIRSLMEVLFIPRGQPLRLVDLRRQSSQWSSSSMILPSSIARAGASRREPRGGRGDGRVLVLHGRRGLGFSLKGRRGRGAGFGG